MNNQEVVSHKVLGLNGTEKEVEVKFNTFCQLCNRRLRQGSTALFLVGDNEWEFYIHINCAIAKMTELHNKTFREEVKVTQVQRKGRVSGSNRTQKFTKKVFIGEGNEYCSFCSKVIKEGQSYSKDKKKRFHAEGRDSCYNRFKRVLNNTRRSV